MKILLISVNRERMPFPVFPLGLAYLARGLGQDGHPLEVIDLCFSQDVQRDLKVVLQRFGPDLIGISLRNLDNLTYPTSLSYLQELEEVISICRQLSLSKIVIGGSGFSLASKELLAHLDVDFGIVGEGEETLLQLVNSLEKKLPISPTPHLLIKKETYFSGGVEGARVSPLSAPDRTLFHPQRYLEEGGMLNLQTKRGCPFSCIYCTYPLLEGQTVRLRKVEEVVEEIQQLIEEGVDYIYFVDDIFNYPPSYAEALCREMVRRIFHVKWSAFVHPKFLTEGLLNWMKEAGCVGIEFGTDSGSPEMLENYKKSFSQEDIIRSSKFCSRLNVNHCHYLLFGGPGETEETIEESFRLMDQLDPTAVIAMLGVRVYPGTEMERLSLSQGVIHRDTNLIYPHFYISPALGGRLEEMIQEKALQRKKWIVPGLEINITQNLIEQIRRFRIRGPLWELVGRMKRPRVKPLGS